MSGSQNLVRIWWGTLLVTFSPLVGSARPIGGMAVGAALVDASTPTAIEDTSLLFSVDGGLQLSSMTAAKLRLETYAVVEDRDWAGSLAVELLPIARLPSMGAVMEAGLAGASVSRVGGTIGVGLFGRIRLWSAIALRLEALTAFDERNDWRQRRITLSMGVDWWNP